jgi:hypothetical protein
MTRTPALRAGVTHPGKHSPVWLDSQGGSYAVPAWPRAIAPEHESINAKRGLNQLGFH